MRVRVRAGISVACFCALSFVICPDSALQAQTPDAPPQSAGASTQDSANDLLVAVGKSVLVDCARTIERVAVGSGDLAEATAVSPSEILLNGKAAGDTSLAALMVSLSRLHRIFAPIADESVYAVPRAFCSRLQ